MTPTDKPTRRTARAVIIRNGCLLVVHRRRIAPGGNTTKWISIPGGGVEGTEDTRDTVVRELYEEMGVVVTTRQLVLIQTVVDAVPEHHDKHYYYVCDVDGDYVPALRADSEEQRRMASGADTYAPAWAPFTASATLAGLYHPYRYAYRLILELLEDGRSSEDFVGVLPLRVDMVRRSATSPSTALSR
jgi:ADP-ribose pyrophosphatase YjhB (NUDIX family)